MRGAVAEEFGQAPLASANLTLTLWKSPAELFKYWAPDISDGIKVNLAPPARTKLLRIN